ncbi:hypothetical protein M3Y99_00514300 [Aphelenchoides fujianensis]|nr:hypothetical protein M3Y99_00514300 [Aphelenchoides fujianensis]
MNHDASSSTSAAPIERPLTSAQSFLAAEFPVRRSALFDRLQSFLPQISAANAQLPFSLSVDDRAKADGPPALTDECGVVIQRLGEDAASDSEASSSSSSDEEGAEKTAGRLEECLESTKSEPPTAAFRAQLVAGRLLRLTVQLDEVDGKTIDSVERLRVKLNDDRVIVLVDNRRTLVDFHLPFPLAAAEATADFDRRSRALVVCVPIDWT